MIPHTYPSQLDENNTTQMVVYYLSNVSGLERWKDYIPVKETPLASPELNSFNINGAIYTSALSSIEGKQAWVDYIPVYEDSLATDAWTINAVGYLTTKSEVVAKALAVIASYGTDAHVYLPGIGVINGLTAGNYLDSAGTTAATVDNPVGLVLDAGGKVGPELVVNGDFSTSTNNYTVGGGLAFAIAAGQATITMTTAGAGYGSFVIPTTAGKTYCLTWTHVGGTIPSLALSLYSGGIGGTGYFVQAVSYGLNKTSTYTFVAPAGTETWFMPVRDAPIGTAIFDNVSCKEVTGIHAIQATTANKPILRRGAVNKLAQSNDLTLWDKINAVVTAGQTDPLGGTSAFKVVCTTGGNEGIYAPTPSQSEGTNSPNARSFWARADSPVDLVIDNTSGGSHKVVSLTTAWQFFTDLVTTTSQGSTWFKPSSTTPVYLWHPQTEAGSVVHDYIPTTTAPASSSTGNYWWQLADSTDNLKTNTAAFLADMDCFVAINRDTTSPVAVLHNGVNSSSFTFMAMDTSSIRPDLGSGTPTYLVNGIPVASTRTALNTAVSSGQFKVVEANNLNLSNAAWTALAWGAYGSGYSLIGGVGVIILCPALTPSERTIVRKFVGQLSGVTL